MYGKRHMQYIKETLGMCSSEIIQRATELGFERKGRGIEGIELQEKS